MKTMFIGVIIVAIITFVVLLGFIIFGVGYDMGSSSNQMSENERQCLIQYGMSCEQKRDEEIMMSTP